MFSSLGKLRKGVFSIESVKGVTAKPRTKEDSPVTNERITLVVAVQIHYVKTVRSTLAKNTVYRTQTMKLITAGASDLKKIVTINFSLILQERLI